MSYGPEEWVRDVLINDSTVKARFGTRWYPGVVPQNPVKPFGTVVKVSAPHEYTHSGPTHQVTARIQVDWYTDEVEDRIDAGNEIRAALETTRDTRGGLYVNRCHLEDEATELWDETEGRATREHRGTHDYMVDYLEA